MQAICAFRLVVVICVLFTGMASRAAVLPTQVNPKILASSGGISAQARSRLRPARASRPSSLSTSASRAAKRAASADCEPCGAVVATRGGRRTARRAVPCHPPDYVDPRMRGDLNAALRELKWMGITPRITSEWRSSNAQGRMYKCSSSRRCRSAHPGLYRAMPPGQSAHEAGLALDISGIATGPRGAKHLTPQGRRIVQVMERHGFNWKYGLADPVHFEADPRDAGYRNLQQAIHVTQTRCQAGQLARAAAHQKGAERRSSAVRPVRTVARGGRTVLRRKA
jgi:hypothetical protein